MTDLNKLFHNKVVIRGLDAEGKCISRQRVKNTLTYPAADVMINALIRSGPSQPTFLYARFGDSGANNGNLSPLDDNLLATVRGDFLASSDSIRGGLWVPILTVPQQTSTDTELYIGNQATFFFRIPYNIPSTQISPSSNFHAGSSYIYALGLAVSASNSDRTQDIIISVLTSITPFPIPPSGQIAIDYPLKLEIQPLTS